METAWKGFKSGDWQKEINVRNFIIKNFSPYDGNADFLTEPTEDTKKLWNITFSTLKEEFKAPKVDSFKTSTITAYTAGYIQKDLEKIVGLQTDEPLKRCPMPFDDLSNQIVETYTGEMKKARDAGIITGLPDSYGRGRIIGDYRRVALYGIDYLIHDKKEQLNLFEHALMDADRIQQREELNRQVKALLDLKTMALEYGFDISLPAKNAKEAIQWTYFGYLAAVKEQSGAAMSIGRISTFLDIYIERDLKNEILTEEVAQELIDHFIMKLRLIRFVRDQEYNDLFSGDPVWVTEAIGGISLNHQHMITKTSYRLLHTLYNLGPSPEPNFTILWSEELPENFKKYCAKVSMDTNCLQYENDNLMRKYYGDDYAIACCVSAMKLGKETQFFGARVNLAKALLYAINGGKDEITHEQISPKFAPISSDILDYDEVWEKFDQIMDWLANLYINTLNVIHYMQDKYSYEAIQMALHDLEISRTMAAGIAGLSVVVDSLSAIKYGKVKVLRDEVTGLATDFEISGEYPAFGNNNEEVDQIAIKVIKSFTKKLKNQKTYRNACPTLSLLTITSNMVYGKKTGNTPDGRKKGEAFAPGANPMQNRDQKGAVAALTSIAKLPYKHAQDGIAYTLSMVPRALGKNEKERISNLVGLLDGYFHDDGHHVNVNILDKDVLFHAMEEPEAYPQLTVRLSGYAVNFVKLPKEQQLDIINRTFHERF